MSHFQVKRNLKEFLQLINEAHLNSGRTLREVGDLCYLDHSYIARILQGERHPQRDKLILICFLGWNLDFYDTELILKAGKYKTHINWKKAGWSQQESTGVNK
jgi:transcriptional regulator with XRE-family HTH domain